MTAAIKFVQGATIGTPGQALMGVTGTAVVVSNGTPASSYKFEVLDVAAGSTVPTGTVQEGSTPSWSFTPDQPGGYLLRLTVVDAGGTTTDERTFGVPEPSGYFIPAFLARGMANNFGGQMRGWAKYLEELLRHLLAGGGGGVPAGLAGQQVVLGNPPSALDVTDRMSVYQPAGFFGGEIIHQGTPLHQEFGIYFISANETVASIGTVAGFAVTNLDARNIATAGGAGQVLQFLSIPSDLRHDGHFTITCELTASASDGTGANVVKKTFWQMVSGVATLIATADESNPALSNLPGAAAAVAFTLNSAFFEVIINPAGMPTTVAWTVSTHLQFARTPA